MSTRVLITMPDNILNDLDEEAKLDSRSRSELVREAVRAFIETRRNEREFKKRQDQAFKTMDEIRESTKGKPHVNSTEIIRAMRGPIGK